MKYKIYYELLDIITELQGRGISDLDMDILGSINVTIPWWPCRDLPICCINNDPIIVILKNKSLVYNRNEIVGKIKGNYIG